MRVRLLSLVVALAVLLLPIPVAGQFIEETLRITAEDVTATQSSSAIYRPIWASGIFVITKVTAGSSLLLDVGIQAYSPTANAWHDWSIECPTPNGITGTGTTPCIFHPYGSSASGHYAVNDKLVMVPPIFRIVVDHGDAQQTSYTVHSQWLTR